MGVVDERPAAAAEELLVLVLVLLLQGSCRIWLIEGRGGGVTGANGFAENGVGTGKRKIKFGSARPREL